MTNSKMDVSQKKLQEFGFALGAFCEIVAIIKWHRAHLRFEPLWINFGIFATAIALLCPKALKTVYDPWMVVAKFLSRINTFILMALIYYLIITPYAVMARLLGKDFLEVNRTGNSYWKRRESSDSTDSYEHQF